MEFPESLCAGAERNEAVWEGNELESEGRE